MSALREQFLTEEDYLKFERSSETRHEYYAGEIVAMAGASRNHNRIVGNTYVSLHNQLRERPCEFFSSEMRVKVSPAGLYLYPDVVVACGTPQYADDIRDILLNPTIIIEVLSPSAESYDRGKKFQHYRTLDSLQEYVLIAQESHRIERFLRQTDGEWVLADAIGLDAMLELPSIQCTLLLADVYDQVRLDDEE